MRAKYLPFFLLPNAIALAGEGSQHYKVSCDHFTIFDMPGPVTKIFLSDPGSFSTVREKNTLMISCIGKKKKPSALAVYYRLGEKQRHFSCLVSGGVGAPLEHVIGSREERAMADKKGALQKTSVLVGNLLGSSQTLFGYGQVTRAAQVSLISVGVRGENLHLKFWVANKGSSLLNFSPPCFEYISRLGQLPFLKKKRSKRAEILFSPESLQVGACSEAYFEFIVPLFKPKGGLHILFEEESSLGDAAFDIFLPTREILAAKQL